MSDKTLSQPSQLQAYDYNERRMNCIQSSSLCEFPKKVANWNLLIDEKSVDRIANICAKQIYDKMKEKRNGTKTPIVFIDILKGATFFGSKIRMLLEAEYKLTHCYDTITVKSYGDGQIQEHVINVTCTFNSNKYKDYIVVLFDELLDGGRTMDEAVNFLVQSGVLRENILTSVAYIKNTNCGVFSNGVRRNVPDLDVYGVHVPNMWVNGTGLDDAGQFRFLSQLWGTRKIEGIPQTDDDMLTFEMQHGECLMYLLMRKEIEARCELILNE